MGGLPGSTLINVDNLAAFGKVVWVPEANAMKVWIEDGLDMLESPWPVREIDFKADYYDSCIWADLNNWSWKSFGDEFVLAFSKHNSENNKMAACSSGYIEIIDVIDSEGHSRKKYGGNLKTEFFTKEDFTIIPYFFNITDYSLSVVTIINKSDLKPPTKPNGEGLVKFKYHCYCKLYGNDITGEFRTDELPY